MIDKMLDLLSENWEKCTLPQRKALLLVLIMALVNKIYMNGKVHPAWYMHLTQAPFTKRLDKDILTNIIATTETRDNDRFLYNELWRYILNVYRQEA